jgi:HlyD family secretion protein
MKSTSAMDQPIKARKVSPKLLALFAGFFLVGLLILIAQRGAHFGKWLASSGDAIPISQVNVDIVGRQVFEDSLSIRGLLAPSNSFVLDVTEPGRVESKLVEDGAVVKKSQLLATLSNTSLTLDLIRSEAEVTQQLNSVRSLELQLNRQRADNIRLLSELDWQRQRMLQKLQRDEKLETKGFVSPAALSDASLELKAIEDRLSITKTAQKIDDQLLNSQLLQLKAATRKLQDSLVIARGNLESLNIRAPVAGQLTSFDLNVGQALGRGARVGQIDQPDGFKVLASVDEFHLPKLAVGLRASATINDLERLLEVRRINPQIKNSQFEIELAFAKQQGKQIATAELRRGQGVNLRLQFSDPENRLVIANGPFFTESKGSWVYVLDASGRSAQKKAVKLGRQNVQFVEIIDGLKAGEKVITSSYAAFNNEPSIALKP